MRKMLVFFALLLIAVSFTGCACFKCQPDVDDIIAKVKKKNDPHNKAQTVETAILKYDSVNDAEKSKIIILLKRPGKIKIISRTGKEFWECAFNGKKAWEYSNASGVRLLTGAEADEVRLQAFLLAPSINIKKVFKSIDVSGSTKIAGQDCWKLICQPQDEFKSQPLTVFVTKKTSLIVRAVEEQDKKGEVIEVVTSFKDYKMFGDFLLPVTTITNVDDDSTVSTLMEVALDQEIPDSVFTAPQAFK